MDLSVPFAGSLGPLFSSGQIAADALALAVLIVGATAVAAVHAPLVRRLAHVVGLCRDLEDVCRPGPNDQPEARAHYFNERMSSSPLAPAWVEFMRLRDRFDLSSPGEAAPVQFSDCLEQGSLLPGGTRGGLLEALPALLLGLGFAVCVGALASGLALAQPGVQIPNLVGLALRGAFWGIALATLAAAFASIVRSTDRTLVERVSTLVEQAYPRITPEEITLLTADAQLRSREQNSELLRQIRRELRDSLRTSLDKIEVAASNAADHANDEQRKTLEHVTRDLASAFHYRLEDQLGALRESINDPDDACEPAEPGEATPDPGPVSESDESRVEATEPTPEDREPGNQLASILRQSADRTDEARDRPQEEPGPETAVTEEVAQMHEEMVETVLRTRASKNRPDSDTETNISAASDEETGEDGKSGYSALLHRYEAPRFSLDELSPELRTFDTDAAIERARSAGVTPGGSLEEDLEDSGATDTLPPAPELFELTIEDDEDSEDDDFGDDLVGNKPEHQSADERRLRVAQFLRRR